MNLLWYTISSLCYMLILFFVFWGKSTNNSVQKSIFRIIMGTNTIGIAFQLLMLGSYLFNLEHLEPFFGRLILIYNIIFLIVVTIYIICICIQKVDTTDTKLKNNIKIYGNIGILLALISAIVIFFLPIDIIKNEEWTLITGSSLTFTLIAIIATIITWIIIIIFNYKLLVAEQKLLPIFLIVLVAIIVSILLKLDESYILFAGLNTVSIYFLYALIEYKEDKSLKIANPPKEDTSIPEELKDFLDEKREINSTSIINNSLDFKDLRYDIKPDIKKSNMPIINLSGKRILMVDDNNFNLKIGVKILETLNANVTTLSSGIDCVNDLKSGNQYDLIFMDDMMPNLSGVETLQKIIHEISEFNTPVIALTANTSEGMREKYLAVGFTDYLTKPIIKSELNDALIKVFDLNKTDDYYSTTSTSVNEYSSLESITYLRKNNIDVESGIELLGDFNMYKEMMAEFLGIIERRLEDLKRYKDSKDLKNYAIQVHSLKSDCKYLGFQKLASISLEHEKRSKENNLKFINNHFNELITEASGIILICKEFMKKNKAS